MRHRSRPFALLILALPLLLGAATDAPGVDVVVHVSGLRSHKGQVLACLSDKPASFPDCSKDASARRMAMPAAQAASIAFGPVPAGTYAISLLHDENGNGRADMAVFIPKEGFGFSRNPAIAFGPPRFARAAFVVTDTPVQQNVQMRYIF